MDKTTQELIDAGNDILKSVSSAIDKNDYSHLADEISKTIRAVSIERKTTYASGTTRPGQGQTYTYRPASQRTVANCPFLQKRISRYSGLGELLTGGFFGLFLALPILISMAVTGEMVGIIIGAVLVAISALLGLKGWKKLKLAGKLHQYGKILKDAEYFKISDLAKVAVKSDEEVLKDIKELIKAGYIPRAKLDSSETTCMITDKAYQMYLGAVQDRLDREAREAKTASENTKASEKPPTQVEALLADGDDYVKFVRQINDIVPDTDEMSNKLYRLESIMNRIFEQVKKDPSSADELHKLMNYYLPTTRKLLTAYVELDKQPEVGENITKTKQEIDSAMDTINEAFENLLDSLFQEMAWDISSDISVMKSMMAQDGLTGEGQGVAAQVQMKF